MKLKKVLAFAQSALFKHDAYARLMLVDGVRFTIAEQMMRIIYPRFKMSDFGNSFMFDREFLRYYESFEGKGHYRTLDRKYMLDQLMRLTDDLEGDTVECGVWAGATSYLICKHITKVPNGPKKTHHIFDSFEGLSTLKATDGSFWTEGDLAVGEAIVRRNLREFDFVQYYKGWIPDRFVDVADKQFSVVHIDVDLHQPTLDSITFFYPRMVPGGLIVCDDYGSITCPGATKAIDDFMADKPEKIIQLTTAQSLIVKSPLSKSKN